MKRIILLLLAFFPLLGWATAQSGDILIWEGDTLTMFSNPLEQRDDIEELRKNLSMQPDFDNWHTACWRGYVAEWTLTDNELYLTNIYNCYHYRGGVKADLAALFGQDKLVDGRLRADWVTEELFTAEGECLYNFYIGYSAIYEKETALDIQKGKLVNYTIYDNSKTYKSKLTHQNEALVRFIASHINWAKTPPADKRVIFTCRTGTTPKPIDIKIVRGCDDEAYNQEALRVINLISDWEVIYQRGEYQHQIWTIPVSFSQSVKDKYFIQPYND